jgi:hypothetical protein
MRSTAQTPDEDKRGLRLAAEDIASVEFHAPREGGIGSVSSSRPVP